MTIVRGSMSSALSVMICLACIACGAVDAFIGPMSAARGSLTRVNNNKQIASVAYSRAPQGSFTSTSTVALENSRARLLQTAAGSNEVSMMAGAAKKTAIITGASSGELAPQPKRHETSKRLLCWILRRRYACNHLPPVSNCLERAERTVEVVVGECARRLCRCVSSDMLYNITRSKERLDFCFEAA